MRQCVHSEDSCCGQAVPWNTCWDLQLEWVCSLSGNSAAKAAPGHYWMVWPCVPVRGSAACGASRRPSRAHSALASALTSSVLSRRHRSTKPGRHPATLRAPFKTGLPQVASQLILGLAGKIPNTISERMMNLHPARKCEAHVPAC